MTKNILIVAGEVSGDIHAASLVKNLKELSPELSFFGMGGKNMSREGVEIVMGIENLAIIGVWEIISKLPHIREAFQKIHRRVLAGKPDLAILVDYPGFNLRLAKGLKKQNIPVVYYITPQVWAWGAFRTKGMKKSIDKAITIFPFEETFLKSRGIDATFAGHPLMDAVKTSKLDRIAIGLDEKKLTIAILPGSREREVKIMLLPMIKACEIIASRLNAQFVLLRNSSVCDSLYDSTLKKSSLPVTSIKDDTYGCLGLSDFVFTSSGTATLEAAIMEKPMLIIYKTSFFTAILFKIFARTPFIGLVNIIAGKKISPEILQYDATPKRLAQEILDILSSEEKKGKQVEDLRKVKKLLGPPGAPKRAARVILDFISRLR